MSQSSPGNAKNPANAQQASSQALLDELRVAADRARDERLKLARLVKHSADLPISSEQQPGVGAASTERTAAITDQVDRLEQAVAEKLSALESVQQNIDNRAQYLESLRHTITDTTRAFVNQVEQAQHFKAHIDAAKQHVRMSAGKVADEVRTTLDATEGPVLERIEQLKELDKQVDQRIARMQQMHKQANEAVDKHLLGALQSAKEQAAALADPLKQQVDEHVAQQCERAEAAIQEKIAELDVDVEEALKPLVGRFDEMVQEASDRAYQVAEQLPDKLKGLGEQHLEELRGKLVERARDIVDGVDEKTIEQAGLIIHENIAKALDKYLIEAEEQSGGYVDGLVGRLNDALTQAKEEGEGFATEIAEKLSQTRDEADELTKGFAEDFVDKLINEREQADQFAKQLSERIEATREEAERLPKEFAASLEMAVEQYRESIRKADAEHEEGREAAIARLDDAYVQAVERSGAIGEKLVEAEAVAIERYKRTLNEVAAKHTLDREAAIAKMDQEVDRIQAMADERVAHAQQILEQSTDGLHARAASAVESALRGADKKLDDYEANAVDHLRVIDDGIEHGIEATRKKLVEFEKQAARQGEAFGETAAQAVQDGIAAAQRKLAGFESGIAQRIALANKSADEAIAAIDERVERAEASAAQRIEMAEKLAEESMGSIGQKLGKVEQDASRRIMQMVELAESSGNAIAESIDELSKNAEQTAAKAQADLDEKLRAFEHISAQALRTAEDTLRDNIGELRDSSRAMIEMVSRQVKAQANEIEPQTLEVISNAEQTMRRRVGELRDAAQGMVDIAVSRLESQLDEVKVKAQQTALRGIDTPQPGSEAA